MNLPTPSPMSFCASFLVWPSTICKIKGMALSQDWIVIRCCELNTVKTRTNQMFSLRTTRVFGKKLYIYIANHIAALSWLFNMHVQRFNWYKFSFSLAIGYEKVSSIPFVAALLSGVVMKLQRRKICKHKNQDLFSVKMDFESTRQGNYKNK